MIDSNNHYSHKWNEFKNQFFHIYSFFKLNPKNINLITIYLSNIRLNPKQINYTNFKI